MTSQPSSIGLVTIAKRKKNGRNGYNKIAGHKKQKLKEDKALATLLKNN